MKNRTIDDTLKSLGYKIVPDAKVAQATYLILTYEEKKKLEPALKSLFVAVVEFDHTSDNDDELIDKIKARIEKL